MAIPAASEKAAAMLMSEFKESMPAKITPTAMPSGILCSVTARQSIVVSEKVETGPSGLSDSIC